MSLSELSLDELYAQARDAAKAERRKAHEAAAKRKGKPPEIEPPVEPTSIYTNPDNWIEGRGIALVHEPTQTFLGNFREWTHRTVLDARRLVRCAEPIAVAGVEYVQYGVPEASVPFPAARRAESLVHRTLDLILDTPAVHAREVLVCVHFYDTWTARCVLVDATTFEGEGSLLLLPAGVDILPCLSRETKRALRGTP